MAAEEDKKFDAVLGGFLVNDLRAGARNLDCPESDVLAAYHERSLLPEEMDSWREHIAGCARCQAVLAGLEATEAIPFGASEDAFREQAALLPAAREERKPAKFPEKSRTRAIPGGARWRWLAPAGALAAGLLAWVAWHENQPSLWKTPDPVKTAKREPSSKSAPEPRSSQQAEPSPPWPQAATDPSARLSNDHASAGGALSADAVKPLEKPPVPVGRAAPGPSANEERVRRENAARDLMAASPASNQPAPGQKSGLARGAAETVEVQADPRNAQIAARQNQLSAESSAEPTLAVAAEAGKKSEADARAVLRPATSAPPAPAFTDAIALPAHLVRDSDLHRIATPNPKTLWRVGSAGMIEFSSDGGASWSRQTSNVLADLTAGSAPSETVCWIVGRAGTILLTTDAGSHWALLHSPLDEDLGGVRSTDALHSTIWNLGNTKVVATANGGVSWKPASP